MATSARSTGETVRIDGLREFQREIAAMGPAAKKEMLAASVEAAGWIRHDAIALASARGGVAAKAAASIRRVSSSREVSVRLGGSGYPFAMGAEFGALRFKQFKPWRGNQWTPWTNSGQGPGYFLHPSVRANSERATQRYLIALERIAGRAFPD